MQRKSDLGQFSCCCGRGFKCERGLLDRADGSARWAQDGSSCLVGVYGPRQTQAYREDAEQAVIMVQYKPRTGLPGSPSITKLILSKDLLAMGFCLHFSGRSYASRVASQPRLKYNP